MTENVCPWQLGYLFASPVRKLWHSPRAILSGFVAEGMTVLEPGPGMGFFTMELGRLVGETGKVVAIDVQAEMLRRLGRRIDRAHLDGRVELRLAGSSGLGVADLGGRVDFVLAFAVAHEVPDQSSFFRELRGCLRKGGRVLFAEPSGHVTAAAFQASTAIAGKVGFVPKEGPSIRSMRSVVLETP